MSRPPKHGTPMAPGVLVSDSSTGGVGVLGAFTVAGCAAVALVLVAGPAPQPVSPVPATPVAAVAVASPTAPDPLPPRPGQPVPTAAVLPVDLVAATAPAGSAVVDAASAVPPDLDPLAVDPAVAQALTRLRVAAAGEAGQRRPGVAALSALDHAFDQVGAPYVWGATGPDTFDCSGLMLWSYQAAGVSLPRVSRDQYAAGGAPVAVDDLLPGDLVFFATASWDPGVVHHVGMYAGGGLMVAAPRPGLTVRVEPVFAQGYVGAVRPVPARGPANDADAEAGPERRGDKPGTATKPGSKPGPATPSPAATSSPPASSSASSSSASASSSASPPPTTTPSGTASSADPDPEPTPTPTPTPTTTPTPDPTTTPSPTSTRFPTDIDVTLRPTIVVATPSPILTRMGGLGSAGSVPSLGTP